MKMLSRLKRIKPHFSYNDLIICSKNNKIYSYSQNKGFKQIVDLECNLIDKILFKSKLASRLLRLGIRSSQVYKNIFFFSYKKKIYSFNYHTKSVVVEHEFRRGRGPLNYAVIEKLVGFEDGIIFGEYFGNNSMKSINIYRRNENSTWSIIYSFDEGQINHIHSIIPDHFRNCIWILAGDFNHCASIWKVENDFKSVKRVLFDKQIYRSCFAFPTADGLIYATDTQLEENSIRLIKIKDGNYTSNELFVINGTCIYACELKDYIAFSTSTEPIHHIKNKFLMYFDNRPGKGIKKNQSDLIIMNKKCNSFKIISSFQKDVFPYGLFGVGTIMFPNNCKKHNTLYAFLSGSIKYDQDTIIFNL